jgi:hypothetical protein
MDQASLEQQLFKAAFDWAKADGYHFGPGADQLIRQMAQTAATAILAAGNAPGMINSAKVAFERLVDEMIAASREIPNYAVQHPHAIGEETYFKALSRLCPLWPIC